MKLFASHIELGHSSQKRHGPVQIRPTNFDETIGGEGGAGEIMEKKKSRYIFILISDATRWRATCRKLGIHCTGNRGCSRPRFERGQATSGEPGSPGETRGMRFDSFRISAEGRVAISFLETERMTFKGEFTTADSGNRGGGGSNTCNTGLAKTIIAN